MNTSELVTPLHLARKAIIYIRQSSPHQVLTNQESLRLQYALEQRALGLGWRSDDIEIIDADLGLTGASVQHREGFKELISKVTLGQVGIILSYEVTRLSRNCSDWYPLLDLCGYKHCLIADRDGVYDPASPNGRLLLGLKGQISEVELHTIRARLTAGLLNKAQRGELALQLPIGLVRDEAKQVRYDPNREVQDRLHLVFDSFLRLRSASQVLRWFNEQELGLPRHDRFGDLVWKKPTVAALLSILKNPAYAGAFVYGRTRTTRTPSGEVSLERLSRQDWKICVKDKYPPYINWDTFEKIQAMLQDNYAEYDRKQSRGIPRPGIALLHGMVYCGECGHKLVVQYKGSPCYMCNYLRQQYGVPVCQRIPTGPVDAHVVEAFFQALSPVELDVYARAVAAQAEVAERVDHAHQQQVERLRYAVALAQRQFNRVDPENRLVAAELEKRWEGALSDLKQAENAEFLRQQNSVTLVALPPDLQAAFNDIGRKLPSVWLQLSHATQKALLRCLIDKVVIHRPARDCVQVRIVWKGGDTTTRTIPVPVGSLANLSTAEEMKTIILDLSTKGQSDADIAQYLTSLGHRSPMQTSVLPNTVKIIRLKHRVFQKRSQSHPRHIQGFLTVPQIADALEISPYWVYYRIDKGGIGVVKDVNTGLYLFPDEPETLEKFKDFKAGKLHNLRFS
jgi:DNA invertase Pin-like site-specific DNA recombinase